MTRQPATADAGDGQVSKSVILQSALRIIDRAGVDGLSMRRLSDEVGRDPTVLYRHIPNKAALLDGVVEIVLGQLRVDTTDPDWAAQLRIVAHDFRRLALTHPNVVPLLVTRPLATPLGRRPLGMLRPLEDVLVLLTSAGFTGVDALHIYRVLFSYLHGHILTELQEIIERPEETDDVLRLGLHRLTHLLQRWRRKKCPRLVIDGVPVGCGQRWRPKAIITANTSWNARHPSGTDRPT
jgi:AcrR family transcriptional regulator